MESADWLPAVFGFVGTVVGGGVTYFVQRMELRHNDRAQWDQDKVKLAGEMIATSRKMGILGIEYSNQWFLGKEEEASKTADQLIVLLDRIRSMSSQLQLIGSAELLSVSEQFYESCSKAYVNVWKVRVNFDGDEAQVRMGYDETVNMTGQIQLLTKTVQKEIRLEHKI